MHYSHPEPLLNSSENYSMASSSAESGRDSSSSSSLVYGASQLPPYPSASYYYSERSSNPLSGASSPCNMSPWHHSIPPGLISCADSSGWSLSSIPSAQTFGISTCLIDSLVREEGHIYSLAAAGPLLYTGSESKNIRVWKNEKEYAAFKSSSGLVKAIIIAGGGDRILTGHQDGKIRVWRISPKDPTAYKRIGSLPRLKDLIRYSLKPSNYAEVLRHRRALWIRHCDAVSCLSISAEQGLLYSGSWDRTFKVWRIADSKCLESVVAHEDAVNSVVSASFDAVVLTGSTDGTVKAWWREMQGHGSKHKQVQILLKQDSAVTALVISPMAPVLYSSSSDGLINFWEWERERGGLFSHGGVLRGHKFSVLCLAAAGRLVLSGSADKSICVWRRDGAGEHSCLSVLTGHSGPVKCLAMEEEENKDDGVGGARPELEHSASSQGCSSFIVYSGSLDKSVKIWRVSELPPEAFLRGPHYFPLDPN